MKTAYRFLFLLITWAANVAIVGNFDLDIHCVPRRLIRS